MHRRPFALLAALLVGFLVLAPGVAQAQSATPTPTSSPTPAPTPTAPLTDYSDTGYGVRVELSNSADEGSAVSGVLISVTDENGELVGQAETDDEGTVEIGVPGKGTYTTSLDPTTLPDGVELSGQKLTSFERFLNLKTYAGVQFQIGVAEVAPPSFGVELGQAMVNGLKLGLLIALAGLGLSLIFGTTGLTNFAHGELITFGAIATFVFNRGFGLPVIAAGACALVLSAAFGWAQDKGLWGPLRRRGTGLIAMMIVSIGLALLMRYLYQYFYGGSTRTLSQYATQGSREYGPILIADKELAIMGVSLVTIIIVCVAMATTRLGKSMRAVADNPALSASSGMRVDGVITNVWVLGTALTGLSGALFAVDRQVSFQLGFKLLLLVFAAVTLGGLGTIWGALVGSLIIGIVSEVGPVFGVPASIKDVGPLLLLILILLVRPQGILGRAQRIG